MPNVAPYRTVRDRSDAQLSAALEASPLGTKLLDSPNETTRWLVRELALVWQEFTARLQTVPLVQAVDSGTVTREDYLCYLRNIRQQVVDGGRWIALMASSMSQPLFPVRSALIGHAAEEHRDYQMLERNYVAAGGAQEEIERAPKNVGSEALSSYMFHQASQPDPLQLFGAMFIVEGLGTAFAGPWADKLQQTLGLPPAAVSFFAYHGKNDDTHYDKLRAILASPFITPAVAKAIVKTARTVGRLYCLQLEELEHV